MNVWDIVAVVTIFLALAGMIFLHFVAVVRGWYDVSINWFDDKFGKPAPACGCGCGK